jgi:hypothetical protein
LRAVPGVGRRDGASVTVLYWHKDKMAKTVFAQIWDYLRVIQRVGGYQIYDPQMECIVSLGLGPGKGNEVLHGCRQAGHWVAVASQALHLTAAAASQFFRAQCVVRPPEPLRLIVRPGM